MNPKDNNNPPQAQSMAAASVQAPQKQPAKLKLPVILVIIGVSAFVVGLIVAAIIYVVSAVSSAQKADHGVYSMASSSVNRLIGQGEGDDLIAVYPQTYRLLSQYVIAKEEKDGPSTREEMIADYLKVLETLETSGVRADGEIAAELDTLKTNNDELFKSIDELIKLRAIFTDCTYEALGNYDTYTPLGSTEKAYAQFDSRMAKCLGSVKELGQNKVAFVAKYATGQSKILNEIRQGLGDSATKGSLTAETSEAVGRLNESRREFSTEVAKYFYEQPAYKTLAKINDMIFQREYLLSDEDLKSLDKQSDK